MNLLYVYMYQQFTSLDAIIIGILVGSIFLVLYSCITKKFIYLTTSFLCIIMSTLVVYTSMFVCGGFKKTVRYKVTLSSETDIEELNTYYNIVGTEGDIYILEHKEETKDNTEG